MTQLQLKPGWLVRDVQKASQSVDEARKKRQEAIDRSRKETSESSKPVGYTAGRREN
jgi:hypothetical protein